MKCILLLAMLLVCDISATSAKGHRGRSHHGHEIATPLPRAETANGAETLLHHEITNRKPYNKEHRREPPLEGEERVTTSQLPNASSVTPSVRRSKKVALPKEDANILHRDAREHNVNKKQLEIPDEIPMEKEFLIHVTSTPQQSKQKSKRSQAPKRRTLTQRQGERNLGSKTERGRKTPLDMAAKTRRGKPRQQNPRISNGNAAKRIGKGTGKSKNHRYPKKYNSQKHSMKKNQRKDTQKREKVNEKNKEKRDKNKERRERRNMKGYALKKDTERII